MSAELLLKQFERIGDAPDATARLRRFVLELAVRGKLTEQSRDEASAVFALENEHPVRRVISVEGPFEIPNNWAWVRFEDIASYSAGRTPSRSDGAFWNTGEYSWVSIADMDHGRDISRTKETISALAKEQIFRSEPIAAGTMLMSFKLTIGKIARLSIPAFHNEAIISIRPTISEMDPYIFLVLPERARRGLTKGAIKGATLNRASLAELLIPLPPVAEQRRIVAKVDELMAICDELEAAQRERESDRDAVRSAELHCLSSEDGNRSAHVRHFLGTSSRLITKPEHVSSVRQAILDLAVRGRLVSEGSGESFPGERLVSLSDLYPEFQNGASSRGDPVGEPVIVLRLADIKAGRISLDNPRRVTLRNNAVAKYQVLPGDILIIRVNGSSDLVGRFILSNESESVAYCDHFIRIRVSRDLVTPKFLRLIGDSGDVRKQIESLFVTTAGQKTVNQTHIGSLQFLLPPVEEQDRIVAKVDELMVVCDELEGALVTEQNERGSLLEAVLHGALEHTAHPIFADETVSHVV